MPDDGPLSTEALVVLRHATVADLRSDADELAALARAVLQPLPMLPLDPVERERVLATALLEAKDHARRLITLVAM